MIITGSGIYKITNIQTGKFYIGSAVNLYSRKWQHFRNLQKPKGFLWMYKSDYKLLFKTAA